MLYEYTTYSWELGVYNIQLVTLSIVYHASVYPHQKTEYDPNRTLDFSAYNGWHEFAQFWRTRSARYSNKPYLNFGI